MIIHYGTIDLHLKNPVVTIGSFDGVHLGHQSVIRCLKETARKAGGESVIITFEPHPREVLYPLEKKPGMLTVLDEKEKILEREGIDHLIILSFTPELGKLDYASFVKSILIDQIGIKGLVIGYDHRFGKDRAGDFQSLQKLSEQYHFFLVKLPVYEANQENISSTKIRNALAIGNIDQVNAFLGYPYSLTGKVVSGQKLGRKLGFPTANLQISDARKLLPAIGVYLMKTAFNGKEYYGLLNVGMRPTVSTSGQLSLEAHLLDFPGRDIYGETLCLRLLKRLRGERKFNDIEELRKQLERDRANALEVLRKEREEKR